jgi:DNA-binding NarL/FixJ family response regulator
MKTKIGIVDDQQLFLKSLSTLINTFENFEVVIEACHGSDLVRKLACAGPVPDIFLVDVSMPVMDGPDTVKYLTESVPQSRFVALSMKDDDSSILAMLRAGCCAYLIKDIHPVELEKALIEVQARGYYNGDRVNLNYRRLILKSNEENSFKLTAREQEFLKLACSDLTYKQIADKMSLAERTIDGYRESLFEKLNVKSRVGMALEALRRNLVAL